MLRLSLNYLSNCSLSYLSIFSCKYSKQYKEFTKKPRKEKSIKTFSRFVESKHRDKNIKNNRDISYPGPFRCYGMFLGNSIDLNELYKYFKRDYLINCFSNDDDEFEVLHIHYKPLNNENLPAIIGNNNYNVQSKDTFLFKEGSIICWGMNTNEENSWIDQVKPYVKGKYNNITNIEEEMNFYLGNDTFIHSDNIILKYESPNQIQKEMLAYSFAIARSILLESIEEEIGSGKNSITKRVIATPQLIKQGKLPQLNEWSKITGEHMALRCKLNLNSSLLDVPDIFWEDYDMGERFQEMQENLDISERIDTLNKRLDMIEQIISSVQNSITDKKSHKLEIIIIILITFEVIFYIADKNAFWRQLRWDIRYPFIIFDKENI